MRVVARDRRALANAIVEVATIRETRLADEHGKAEFRGLSPGRFTVTVRHIGYSPKTTDFQIAGPSTELLVSLDPIALRLPSVTSYARGRCDRGGLLNEAAASDSSSVLLQQLAINAEHLDLVARERPFRYAFERTTTTRDPITDAHVVRKDTLFATSSQRFDYRPGHVLGLEFSPDKRRQPEVVLHMPTFIDLKSPAFRDAHCFHFAGIEDEGTSQRLRIDFQPLDTLQTPDIEGSVFLNATSLRVGEVRVALTHPEQVPNRGGLVAMTATSYFSEILPSLVLADLVVGATMRASSRDTVSETEERRILSVSFLEQTSSSRSAKELGDSLSWFGLRVIDENAAPVRDVRSLNSVTFFLKILSPSGQ